MMTAITPWAATVHADIEKNEPLFIVLRNNYTLRIYNTGDSIWLTASWPKSGCIAFRLAFGMNSDFEQVSVNEIDDGILVTGSTRIGHYRITISFPKKDEPIFRYTTTIQTFFPILIPFWPRDIVPITKEGRVENTSGKIHSHQIGGRSGQMFFSMTKPKNGSVFYFQNLTAISEYCDECETTVADSVGGQWPEIGFRFPVNSEKPLPADTEFVISDAFILLSTEIPENDLEVTQQYLSSLASIYMLLPKPETHYHDWPGIANNAIHDLSHNKGCWTQTNGQPYLNAYVSDYKTPAEIMVQLSVLLPLKEYLEWKGDKHKLYDDLLCGLDNFYDENLKSLVRWHPALEGDLDRSEEQKQEMVMDSWYLHHPLMNLCRMALKGDKNAEKLFLKSIDYPIKAAHHFDYEWPVFYKMTTFEVIKAETRPGEGGEKDVAGSYAHLMLLAWKITKEQRYFNEAIKAVKHLDGLAFNIFYQANNTAFAAGALLELYKKTNEKYYLELSYCCLAGIFKNVQLWDCNYGYGINFPSFFSIFPLNDAPYTAAYEELEVYAALHHYLLMSEGIEILPSLKILIPEFIKYAVNRLAYYYPPMLPEDMIADNIKTGEVQKDLWVPLEDIHDGWEKSGEVGQEVYGAGLPFGIVPRHYYIVDSMKAMFFIDYPVTDFRRGKKSITFRIIGNDDLKGSLHIIGMDGKPMRMKVAFRKKTTYTEIDPNDKSGLVFKIPGNSIIRVTLE
jgi:hypothetical protein